MIREFYIKELFQSETIENLLHLLEYKDLETTQYVKFLCFILIYIPLVILDFRYILCKVFFLILKYVNTFHMYPMIFYIHLQGIKHNFVRNFFKYLFNLKLFES